MTWVVAHPYADARPARLTEGHLASKHFEELAAQRERDSPFDMKAELRVEGVHGRVAETQCRQAASELLGIPRELRLQGVDHAVIQVPAQRPTRVTGVIVVLRVLGETPVNDALGAHPQREDHACVADLSD